MQPAHGVSRRSLLAASAQIAAAAWSPDGRELATASDGRMLVFDAETGRHLGTAAGTWSFGTVSWHSTLNLIAGISGGAGSSVQLVDRAALDRVVPLAAEPSTFVDPLAWAPDAAALLHIPHEHPPCVYHLGDEFVVTATVRIASALSITAAVAWIDDRTFAASDRYGVALFDAYSGERKAEIPQNTVRDLVLSPDRAQLAVIGAGVMTVIELDAWRAVIEVPISTAARRVAWSPCSRFVALLSDSPAAEISLLDASTWSTIHSQGSSAGGGRRPFEFSPTSPPRLAVAANHRKDVEVLELEPRYLLVGAGPKSQRYTTAKIVLVGDSGVGKTGLGYRVATGSYKDHPSTHGQHFWVVDDLGTTRSDGTECEAVLWDLAGQPDYRLTHVLFLDDVDAALVLFDATRGPAALDSVDFWIDALRANGADCPIILIGGRIDRGGAVLSREELEAFAERKQLTGGYIETSAATGEGVAELVARVKTAIHWDAMSATVASATFRFVKGRILSLKQASAEGKTAKIVDLRAIKEWIDSEASTEQPSESDFWVAVRNLEVHGYVRILRTAAGDRVVLLQPELVQNLAASIVLAARRNPSGLGAIDEEAALAGGYDFPEADALSTEHAGVLLDSAFVLLLEHNVCFREQLGERRLLIFPELINEKPQSLLDSPAVEHDATYVVEGNVQNVYASLVVLLGYTNVLVRHDQWQDRAEYELDGLRVGFEQRRPAPSRLDLTLVYEPRAQASGHRLFQGLVEQFLRRRGVSVRRYPRVVCSSCSVSLEPSHVMRVIDKGAGRTFCPDDGTAIEVPASPDVIALHDVEGADVLRQARVAGRRTALSVALTQFRRYVDERLGDRQQPSCFVSYAWGDAKHEQWVRNRLVPDLVDGGVDVVLDVAETEFGDHIARFVERMDQMDYVAVVGTPEYRRKHENRQADRGSVVAAESDLLYKRLLGSETAKASVIPLLLVGQPEDAFPPLLQGRVYADFRSETAYFTTLFKLVLRLWDVNERDGAVSDLLGSLTDADVL